MPRIKIVRIALAFPLLFGFPMVIGGVQILQQWSSESGALLLTGALILLCGTAMMLSAIFLLASLGRARLALWSGGLAAVVCAGVVSISTFFGVLPCSGPA